MAFFSLAALRTILATETDADSPGSEELLSQLRENWEALLMLLFDTNEGGTITTIAETVLTDSGQAWTTDAHIGRTLLITAGTAIGNTYTIDDNDGTTLTLTGDTLVSDGVATTDTFLIFYDLKVNADGHDHNGTNSKHISVHQNHSLIIDQILCGSVDTSYATYAEQYHYHTENMNSFVVSGLGKNTASQGNSDFKIIYGAASGTGAIDSDTYVNVITGVVDISGEAEGWKRIYIQVKKDSGSGATVYLQSFTMLTY